MFWCIPVRIFHTTCSFAVNKESVGAESNRDLPCNAVHPRVEARLQSSLHGNMGIIAYRRAPVQASVWSFVRCVNRRIPAVGGPWSGSWAQQWECKFEEDQNNAASSQIPLRSSHRGHTTPALTPMMRPSDEFHEKPERRAIGAGQKE
jgi:hypothetical protein